MIELKMKISTMIATTITISVFVSVMGMAVLGINLHNTKLLNLSNTVTTQKLTIENQNGVIAGDQRLLKELRRQLTHKKKR